MRTEKKMAKINVNDKISKRNQHEKRMDCSFARSFVRSRNRNVHTKKQPSCKLCKTATRFGIKCSAEKKNYRHLFMVKNTE